MATGELPQDVIDAYYARVRKLGLKPTKVPTVWQTPDEQDTQFVQDPATMDADEREIFLRNLERMWASPSR